jgi:FAD/FMN-containing dehydrogenase
MNDTARRAEALAETLREELGPDAVVTDLAEREACSADLYSAGSTCALVLRPQDRASVAQAVASVTRAGFAVIARGGGLTYTGGYTPVRDDTVVLDLRRLDRIVDIGADDMYVTVEAGVNWKQLHAALAPLGLRLPCFGTFSGAGATVGGGLSNGALFFGTAR